MDVFPDLVLERVFLELNLREVLKCRLVCKQWENVIRCQSLWRQFCKKNCNFQLKNDNEDDSSDSEKSRQKLNSVMYFEARGWFSFGLWENSLIKATSDDTERYVFRWGLRQWSNGIITSGDFDPFQMVKNYREFTKAVSLVLSLKKVCHDDQNINCSGCYNDMESQLDVCLFPWDKGTLPSPKELLQCFSVHPGIIKLIEEKDIDVVSERLDFILPDDETKLRSDPAGSYIQLQRTLNSTFNFMTSKDERKIAETYKWLQKFYQPSLMCYASARGIHPQPYFHITLLSQGWAGGIITTLNLIHPWCKIMKQLLL